MRYNLSMDLGEEVKALRMQLEELTEGVRTISERLNAQYTDLMLHLKELEADRELIDRIVFDAAHNMERLYEDAKQLVIRQGQASTWFLQRRLEIGYAQAAKLMEKLEDDLIVSAADGAKPRQVLVTDMAELEAGEHLLRTTKSAMARMSSIKKQERWPRRWAEFPLPSCSANWASATHRAARLIDMLQEHGVIEEGDGAKPRKVIAPKS